MVSADLNYCLCFLLTLLYATKCSQTCRNSVNEYENHLATKTPYRVVANYSSTEIQYGGCTPTKLWAVIRHGTRNPSPDLIEKMRGRLLEIRDLILENLPEATNQINNHDLDLFRLWKVKQQPKDETKLTHEGEEEMLLLAERLQGRFPSILSNIYSDSSYKFRYTYSQRTKKSAQAFTAGLFGRNVVKDVNFPEPLKKDPILRFYKLCNKWSQEVKKNPSALKEWKKFCESPIMEETISNVNNRTGFDDELDFSDVHAMYMTCAYETAWNKRKRSPWCAAFNIEDLKVLEYSEDLKYYWIDGYGHELTYKQACPAANNLFEFFQNNETYPKATIYFTHSGTLLKMLAFMGLYKEERHLQADDFDKNSNRKWKVSQIDTFGTNLAFALYDCQGQKKVLTLHQEHVIRLPSCPDADLCDLNDILNYYNGNADCLFDQMCENTA